MKCHHHLYGNMFNGEEELIRQNITYSGKTTIEEDTTQSNENYISEAENENAILVKAGTATILNSTINKSGEIDNENGNFYGTNAAVLVHNGATLNIENSSINTNGNYANGVFAYGKGEIVISNSTIKTTKEHSRSD